jgi:hypothetical protein
VMVETWRGSWCNIIIEWIKKLCIKLVVNFNSTLWCTVRNPLNYLQSLSRCKQIFKEADGSYSQNFIITR